MAKKETMTTGGPAVPETPWNWREHTSAFATAAVGMIVYQPELLAAWDGLGTQRQQAIMDGIHHAIRDAVRDAVRSPVFARGPG